MATNTGAPSKGNVSAIVVLLQPDNARLEELVDSAYTQQIPPPTAREKDTQAQPVRQRNAGRKRAFAFDSDAYTQPSTRVRKNTQVSAGTAVGTLASASTSTSSFRSVPSASSSSSTDLTSASTNVTTALIARERERLNKAILDVWQAARTIADARETEARLASSLPPGVELNGRTEMPAALSLRDLAKQDPESARRVAEVLRLQDSAEQDSGSAWKDAKAIYRLRG